jgi:antitoxin component YwqK of YwqJK toxin-antitoxin module
MLIFAALLLILIGCKTNQIKNKKREGFWVELYEQDTSKYKSKGYYQASDPKKTWRYYLNGKLIKKEKYKLGICNTTFYFKNGKIESQGQTNLSETTTETHWFYNGNWRYYDEKGKLTCIRNYNNGELIHETIMP